MRHTRSLILAGGHRVKSDDWLLGWFFLQQSKGVKRMKNCVRTWWMTVAMVLLGAIMAVAQTQQGQQGQGSAGVKVNPSAVQQKAQTPPPSNATPASTIGNKVQETTPAGTVSWAEQLDVDGNGQVDQATLAWDAKDKVLLSNTTGTFTCSDGSTGNGELLIGVNGAGNPRNRPVGSGFWLASVDKGQCGVQANTLYGCKFDASGNPTTCGVAQLDQQNEDLIIVTAQPAR